ncbi:unnamed protein product [Zymoseptoria tritici ST99CH_1E4]|uniref:Uncharacterized protein n=1 Tax=Zymoseptoria tritici ST99CH_1E4 TaxID=1276532 RepID=A0A2H1HBR9_ZYMTR|nr:unnamed protein product [Zymoseptoria tritici ST99CH_1E4]
MGGSYSIPTRLPVFELPVEVQALIFGHELRSFADADVDPTSQPALLAAFPTNQLLRDIYYAQNSFVLDVQHHDITPYLDFLQGWTQVARRRRYAPLDNIRALVSSRPEDRNWDHFERWLRYIFQGRPVKIIAQPSHSTELRMLVMFMDIVDLLADRESWAGIERNWLPGFRKALGALHPEWLL